MTKNGSHTALGSLAIVAALGFAMAACPATLDDRCSEGACDPSASSSGGDGGGGDGSVVGPPAGCDPKLDTKDPAAAPCVVESYGVFVAPTGKPDAPGTKAEPYDTVTSALKNIGNKARVYVCEGTYVDTFEVRSTVSIVGGYDCGSWAFAAKRPRIEGAAIGKATLRVRAVADPIVISDLEIVARAANQTDRSSIAAFVSDSPAVSFRRARLEAQPGVSGAEGAEGVTGTSDPADLNGIGGAMSGPAGAKKTCACTSGGVSVGGVGGESTGAVDGANGTPTISPPEPLANNGAGGTQAQCNASSTSGTSGSNAPTAKSALSPQPFGVLSADGWATADGASGETGGPGQGGGGGGGRSTPQPAGGGSGACGGCGGTGGGGGKGGGSSIALLLLNAPAKLDQCELRSKDAGAGGLGKSGGTGQTGGFGGAATGTCSGGNGGRGGDGGAGAGGSGGVSAGVAHKGGAPNIDGATESATTIGIAGPKGIGGKPGENDGLPGDAKKTLAL